MDTFISWLPELLAAGMTAWGARQRLQRSRADAARVAADAARAALAARLEAVSELGQRFADALADGDLPRMAAIERERKARGL